MKRAVHGLNESDMLKEITYELTTMKETIMVTSEHVLAWTM